MVLAIKLLDNNELSKIIFSKIFQNKHCTLCVKNYLLKIQSLHFGFVHIECMKFCTAEKAVEKTVTHIGYVQFLHGCHAWRHFVSKNTKYFRRLN